MRLRVIEEGSLEALRAALTESPYDVLHLSGHGLMSPDGPRLVLEDAEGDARQVSAGELGRVLRDAPHRPALVVVSSCHSADASGVASFVAQLVQEGVEAAIGWDRPVGDALATEAAVELYRAVVGGVPLVAAVGQTRFRVELDALLPRLPTDADGRVGLADLPEPTEAARRALVNEAEATLVRAHRTADLSELEAHLDLWVRAAQLAGSHGSEALGHALCATLPHHAEEIRRALAR